MESNGYESPWTAEDSGAGKSDAAAERRAQIRLEPEALSAILNLEGERHVVYVGDISYSGAKMLNAPAGLKTGSTIWLDMCLADRDQLTLVCKVVYVKGNEAQSEAGVKFENVADEETRALIAYLCEIYLKLPSMAAADCAVVP